METVVQLLILIFGALVAIQNIADIVQYYFGKRREGITSEFMTSVSFLDFLLAILLFYQLTFKGNSYDKSWVLLMGAILFLLCVTSIWRRLIQRRAKR